MGVLDWLRRSDDEKEAATQRIEEVEKRTKNLERILEAEAQESIRLEREGRRWRSSGADGAR